METKSDKVARLVANAGGKIVGRTRLQKISYVLEHLGLGEGFDFTYHHYGPFSESLSGAVKDADALNKISEKVELTQWGGKYSVFTTTAPADKGLPELKQKLISLMNKSDSVALELAATALFLFDEHGANAWNQTTALKPEKSDLKLEDAKSLYKEMRDICTDLPNISIN